MGHNGRTFGRISESRKRFKSINKNKTKRSKWSKNKAITKWRKRETKRYKRWYSWSGNWKEKETGRNKLLEQRARKTSRTWQ